MSFTESRLPINYAVRNLTTGDEEDIRILEDPLTLLDALDGAVRDRAAELIHTTDFPSDGWSQRWQTASDELLSLLLPLIERRALYDSDYNRWEEELLEGDQ